MMSEHGLLPQQQTIEDFLSHITRRWGEIVTPCRLEVVHLTAEDKARVRDVQRFRPTAEGLEQAAAHIAAMNRHKLNSYAVINPVRDATALSGQRAKAEDILASFYHWADADDQQAADNIRSFVGPKVTMHVLTGSVPSPRPHVYWELEEPTLNLPAWTETQRNIAATLGTDPAVVDPPRIMRVAGTINWPKPKKVAKGYIAELTNFKIYDANERPPVTSENMARVFARAAPKTQASDTDMPPEADRKSPSDYAAILDRARTDGTKHGGVRDLAASLAGQGVNRAMAEALVRMICPVWDENVEDLIDSAYAKFYAPAPEAVEARPTAADTPELEWFDQVQPALHDHYLVKGLLAQGAMSVIYGPSNSGKTFFALDLMFHLAAGINWRGMAVNKAAVLYLAAEGGSGIANRIVALRNHTNAENIPLALRRGGLDLLRPEADLATVLGFANAIAEKHPDLPLVIVIDTLSRVMAGGDENGPVDMTQFIRNIDVIREKTKAHVCIIHHSGKDSAKGARGHSSLRAATDTEIEVEAPQEGETSRMAMDTKQRDYQSHKSLGFDLKQVTIGVDQDGEEVSSCVVEAAVVRRKRKLTKNQRILAETFDQMVADGHGRPTTGGVGMPERGRFTMVEMNAFRTACEGKMAVSNTRDAFLRAFDALNTPDGIFCMASGFVWRTDKESSR